ncbi:MAG: hypothetical protein AAFV88_05550 [Planctomycetota bacterium]
MERQTPVFGANDMMNSDFRPWDHKYLIQRATDIEAVASNWVEFYREVFGRNGLIDTVIDDKHRHTFDRSETNVALLKMLTELRSVDCAAHDGDPQRMITIRIPASMHERLIDEAADRRQSLNKLCISKLVVPVDERFNPPQKPNRKIRGRRPGPQKGISYVSDIVMLPAMTA